MSESSANGEAALKNVPEKNYLHPWLVAVAPIMYSFNAILFCAGSVIFAIGMWIRFDKDTSDFVESLELQAYWYGTAIVMTGSVILMFNSFAACCGVYLEYRYLLLLYKLGTGVSFILLLGGSIFILSIGLEQTKMYSMTEEAMKLQIHQYQWDTAARRIVDTVQETIGCCGGQSSRDYTEINLPIPDTCRNHVTGNQYSDSCAEGLSWYFEKRTGWLCGISLTVCFIQMFLLLFAICYRRHIDNWKRRQYFAVENASYL